jgi:hypothetical protein
MQITFYIPVGESDIRQDFAEACEYYKLKPNHVIVDYMNELIDKHESDYKDQLAKDASEASNGNPFWEMDKKN